MVWQLHVPLRVLVLLFATCVPVNSMVLYVSPLGRDTNDGLSPATAVATIGRALELLDLGLARQQQQQQQRTIFVREGTYHLAEPLVLGPRHSDVIISNYPGDANLPVISGGQSVGPWRRLATRGAVWTATWPGAANFSRLYTDPVHDTEFSCSRLPVDPRAYFHWRSPLKPCTTVPHARPSCPEIDKTGFVYDPADLPATLLDAQPAFSALRVRVQSAPFESLVHHVATINRSSHQLLFRQPDAFALGHYGTTDPNRTRWSLENAMPTKEGTWAWVRGQLYLRMGGGDDPNKLGVLAPVLSTLLIVLSGTSGVQLQGLRFQHSGNGGALTDHHAIKTVAAVRLLGVSNVTMSGCELAKFDAQGLLVSDSSHVHLSSLYIHSGGRRADNIRLSFLDSAILEDSVIHGSSVSVNAGHNVTISHVEIYDTYNSGIRVFGQPPVGLPDEPWYVVRDSHFHQIGQGAASDFGAVYLAAEDLTCYRDNQTCAMRALITGNVIHRARHLEYGANGVYLDAGVSAVTVQHNLVVETGASAIYCHCGSNNTIRSNIFARNNLQDGRAAFQGCDESGVGMWQSGQASATNNIVLVTNGSQAPIAGGTPSTMAWAKFATTTRFNGNLYSSARPVELQFPPGVSFAEWQQQNGEDQRSVLTTVAGAGFVNASGLDFRLRPDSVAASKLGVVEPRYSVVGPRKTPKLLRLAPPQCAFARYPFFLMAPCKSTSPPDLL